MTRNQIIRDIASATKKAEKAERNSAMYFDRRDKSITKANAMGIQVTTADFHVCDSDVHANDAEMYRTNWLLLSAITMNWEYALANQATAARENRRIAALNEQLAAMDATENHVNDMATILETAMHEFKEEWFGKMTTWYTKHHAEVQAVLPAVTARCNRMKAIQARMKAQYGVCATLSRSFRHARAFKAISNAVRECGDVMMDKAATMDFSAYMAWVSESLERDWATDMEVLVRKLERYNINIAAINVQGIAVTEKGFECVITDGRNRRIYTRMIWAAEYSALVAPHTRYIITEKKI